MFIGDFEKAAPWQESSVRGCKRFLDRVWALHQKAVKGEVRRETESILHKTIKKVSDDIENLKFNTAIAALMTILNEFEAKGAPTDEELRVFLLLLDPFAPHICEEMWADLGFDGMVCEQKWPVYDEKKTVETTVEIAVQVNGKVRGRMMIDTAQDEASILAAAKELDSVKPFTEGKQVVKEMYIKGRLVNIVVK